MPIDPQMPDTVSATPAVSPQQLTATNQVLNNVASSSGSPAPQSMGSKALDVVGSGLMGALQGFAMARMGQDFVGQRLRAKYQQQAQDKEMAFKASLAKQDAERQFIMAGINNQGSQFLQNPKLQKQLMRDPEEWAHYQALGQAVDAEKESIKKGFKAAGLRPELADLPPEALKMIGQQKEAQLKQQNETQLQNNRLEIQKFDLKKMQLGVDRALAELDKARADKANKTAEAKDKLWTGFTNTLGKHRDSFIQGLTKQNTSGGQAYTEQQAIDSAAAFNKSVQDAAKKAAKDGHPFDPQDYMVSVTPGPTIPGWFGKTSKGPYQVGPATPMSVPETPNADTALATGTPTPTGPEAAPQSIRGRKVIRVPVSEAYPKGLKFAD